MRTEPYPNDCDRGRQTGRVLQIIFKLSKRAYSTRELEEIFHVNRRTIRRDVILIERIGIPVYITSKYEDDVTTEKEAGCPINCYRVDKHWASQYFR